MAHLLTTESALSLAHLVALEEELPHELATRVASRIMALAIDGLSGSWADHYRMTVELYCEFAKT